MALGVDTNNSAQAALATLASLSLADAQAAQGQAAAAPQSAQLQSVAPAFLTIDQSAGGSLAGLNLVQASLDRASSVADLAAASGQSVVDLLNQIKAKVGAATDPSLNTSDRAALAADFSTLAGQIGTVVSGASFGGVNLLDGSAPGGVKYAAGGDGGTSATLSAENMSLGGPLVTFGADASMATATAAASLLSQVNQSLVNVNGALSDLGAQAAQIGDHSGFVSLLSGATSSAADLTADGARLQALQVQQQLSALDSPIANTGPQYILSLFK